MKNNRKNNSSIAYYDALSGTIRIGNNQPEHIGSPCASPLELTDAMKNKIRKKKRTKTIIENKR